MPTASVIATARSNEGGICGPIPIGITISNPSFSFGMYPAGCQTVLGGCEGIDSVAPDVRDTVHLLVALDDELSPRIYRQIVPRRARLILAAAAETCSREPRTVGICPERAAQLDLASKSQVAPRRDRPSALCQSPFPQASSRLVLLLDDGRTSLSLRALSKGLRDAAAVQSHPQ